MNGLDDGLDDDIQKIITLVSNDNQVFEISADDCFISDYLKNILELDHACSCIHIQTRGSILKIIVDFLKFYKTKQFHRLQKPIPKDFSSSKFIHDNSDNVFIEPYYTNLFNLDNNKLLIESIEIVNYLSITPLLELVCAKTAHIIRDMTNEDEIKFLNIENLEQYMITKN